MSKRDAFTQKLVDGDADAAISILNTRPGLATAMLAHDGFSSDVPSIVAATLCRQPRVVSALLDCGAETRGHRPEQQ